VCLFFSQLVPQGALRFFISFIFYLDDWFFC
jgi:hypothetical protein